VQEGGFTLLGNLLGIPGEIALACRSFDACVN
jgi:hypothetical protein